MRLQHIVPTILALHAGAALGDFVTGSYPSPVDLSSDKSPVAAGWKELTESFDQYFQGKLNASTAAAFKGSEDVTFSMGMFSLKDPKAVKLQYHHTSEAIKNAEVGTHKVDQDSIYRIASVSKLITVLAGMTELSDEDWHRPLSKIIPGFKNQVENSTSLDVIKNIQWDKITPWALATQLSGVPIVGVIGDQYDPAAVAEGVGPVVQPMAVGTCLEKLSKNLLATCDDADLVSSVKDMTPNFEPWKTPVYSDLGFMLLGLAISNVTDKTMTEVYQSAIFDPLNMTSSSDKSINKTLDRAVVTSSLFNYTQLDNFAFTAPSGGILSTLTDLQKLGLGILNSTLLSQEATDKWMKPVSHTGSLSYSIGAPWEIHRFVHPKTGKVTDVYTKLGDSGDYGGGMAIIPQYNAGFAMLNGANVLTTPQRSEVALHILDYVTATVLPALEAEALAEAKSNFIGEYKSSDGGVETTLKIGIKKSVTASVNSELIVTEWKYNGTDIITSNDTFAGEAPRLEQSIVRLGENGKPKQIEFILSPYIQTTTYMKAIKAANETGVLGTWSGLYHSDGDFTYTDSLRWGGQSMRALVFDVDDCGKATKCSIPYQRVELKRSKH